jgi:hypothetical protein
VRGPLGVNSISTYIYHLIHTRLARTFGSSTGSIYTAYIYIYEQEWGKIEQYLARYPILAHFPSRKSAKGVPKRWEINIHQIYFSNPRMIMYHKESLPVLFWDEKRPWLGRGGL